MFSHYRAHLEAELVKQELLLKFVIADKEKIIQRQDEEIKLLRAECERYKLLLLPRLMPQQPGSRLARPPLVPAGETSWEAYRDNHIREQEELAKKEKANVHGQSGEGIHKSASADAVRSDDGHKQVSAAEVGPANGKK